MLALFLFSTTAVFVAVMRVEKLEERTKRRKLADIRFMPKCVQTLQAHSLPRSAHTRCTCTCMHTTRGMLLPLWAMRVGFAPQPTGMPEALPDAHTHPTPSAGKAHPYSSRYTTPDTWWEALHNPAQQVSPRDSYKRGRGVWGGAHCTQQQHIHTKPHATHIITTTILILTLLSACVTRTQMARRRAHTKRLRRRLRRPPRRSQLAGRQRPCGSQRTGTARLSTPPTQRRRPAD